MPYRRVSGIRTWFGMIREIAVSSIDLLSECKAIAASSLYGNPTGSSAPPVEISLGSGLAFSGTSLTATATVPTGGVMLWPVASTPTGWLRCDGAVYDIADYPALGALLGSTYGGNGTTTFGVPDYRGRTPVGAGQGSGLSNRTLGSTFGAESRVLTIDDLPDHTHTFTVPVHSHTFSANPHTHTDNGHGHGVTDPMHGHLYDRPVATASYGAGASVGPSYATAATTQSATGITIQTGYASLQTAVVSGTTNNGGSHSGTTGGVAVGTLNQAVSLMQPSLATQFVIKT